MGISSLVEKVEIINKKEEENNELVNGVPQLKVNNDLVPPKQFQDAHSFQRFGLLTCKFKHEI